jgi:hypothetical protein
VRDELVKIPASRRHWPELCDDGPAGATIPEPEARFITSRFHAHDVWHHTLAAVDVTAGPGDPPGCSGFAALLHDVAAAHGRA